MQQSTLAIFVVLLKIGAICSNPVIDGIIAGKAITVNGKPMVENNGKYPFMAAMIYYGKNMCGATIIKPKFVLTAAHCFLNLDPTKWVVRVGSFLMDEKPDKNNVVKEVRVAGHKKHPHYNPPESKGADIAVVTLVEPLIFNRYINAIKLPTANMAKKFIKKKLTLLGYGEYKTGVKSKFLRKGIVEVSANVKNRVCGPLPYIQMCTVGYKSEVGLENGDSGGPLVLEVPGKASTLIGVASFGLANAETNKPWPNTPSIFVEVATVREWIYEQAQI